MRICSLIIVQHNHKRWIWTMTSRIFGANIFPFMGYFKEVYTNCCLSFCLLHLLKSLRMYIYLYTYIDVYICMNKCIYVCDHTAPSHFMERKLNYYHFILSTLQQLSVIDKHDLCAFQCVIKKDCGKKKW